MITTTSSFGSRLRDRREARGLDLESCAHTLRLPARVLRQLENNQYDRLDHAIYLASYIGKYARFLGLDEASIQAELKQLTHVPAPTLVPTGGISRSRYLLERYTTGATYVVLTAVIMVPMIWLGVRGTLDRDISRLAPLDARPVAQQDAPERPANATEHAGATTAAPSAVTSPAAQGQPLLASMASFPELGNGSSLTQPAPAAPTVPAAPDATGHSLTLDLANTSWVEVLDSKGTRLEYGLLPAGSSKTYRSDNPLVVRIGNANGAQVSIDGQRVSLDAYRHANIAHFRIDMRDGKATPAGV